MKEQTLNLTVSLRADGPVTTSAVIASVQSAVEDYQRNHGLSLEDDLGMISRVEVSQGQHELTVWFGEMPESNGKTNYTAILRRKGGGSILDGLSNGITIARSEYPDRVRYEADRMRFLIGEIDFEPDILAYDADKHSGYVHPDRFKQMAESKGCRDFSKGDDGEYLDDKTRAMHEGWKAARSTW